MILEELRDTGVETRVETDPAIFMKMVVRELGSREVDKIHVFPEQNTKYRVSCARLGKMSKISQQNIEASGADLQNLSGPAVHFKTIDA